MTLSMTKQESKLHHASFSMFHKKRLKIQNLKSQYSIHLNTMFPPPVNPMSDVLDEIDNLMTFVQCQSVSKSLESSDSSGSPKFLGTLEIQPNCGKCASNDFWPVFKNKDSRFNRHHHQYRLESFNLSWPKS